MENVAWKDLVYKDYDLSDKFEYNLSGEIRNKKTGRICKRIGNGVTVEYFGDTLKINIPYLLTGKYMAKKPRGAQKKPKSLVVKDKDELRILIKQVALEVWMEMSAVNNSGHK